MLPDFFLKQVISIVIHLQEPLRFTCTGCGACCTGNSEEYYIETSRDEQEAIRNFLGITRHWFRRRYLTKIAEEMEGLKIENSGRCVFLSKSNSCKIYPVRPMQCQTYPFWPEILISKKKWRAEKRRCEGVDNGTIVPRRRVAACLKLQHLRTSE